MKQVKLTKTNEGVEFWLKNDDDSPAYIRGEFVAKEQGYKVYPGGKRDHAKVFKKDKKVWVKF